MALSLLSLASISLVGCNNESSYCDETGCYFCDGLGCRLVNPPTRARCTCASDCASGSSCTSLGCTVGCTADTQCPMGTQCRAMASGATGRYCLGPREPAPTVAGDCSCTSSAMCARLGPNYSCILDSTGHNGMCRIAGCGTPGAPSCPSGQACVNGMCGPVVHPVGCPTIACATGSFCLDGSCVPQVDTCRFNTECGATRSCVNQLCTTACGAANPCPTGATCGADGFCHEVIPPVTGCTTNADCAAGQACVNGRCFAGCSAANPCPTGNYCDSGVCRLDTRLNPGCGNGAACAMGAVCRNGACRSPCTMDAECPRFDVQTNFCVQMVCATTAEATANCTTAADCRTAGQSCVNGTCR